MAKLIPDDQWQELRALADALLARAREISEENRLAGPAVAAELDVVYAECQALSLATMALAASCPLAGAEMFIGMGGALGAVLAQQTDAHEVLLQSFRVRMRAAYNEVVAAAAPRGTA